MGEEKELVQILEKKILNIRKLFGSISPSSPGFQP